MANSLKKKDILEGEVVEDKSAKLKVVDGRGVSDQGSDTLEKQFKLKSEFFEKNVKLPDLEDNQDEGPITQVKIFRDSGIDVVNPKDLKKFITENKDIKQVVVEKVSIDEATRVSLLFEPKHHASRANEVASLVQDTVDKLEGSISELDEEADEDFGRSYSLDELENLVNKEFLDEAKNTKTTKAKLELVKENQDHGANEAQENNQGSEQGDASNNKNFASGLKFKWPKKDQLSSEQVSEPETKEDYFESKESLDTATKPKNVSLKLKSESNVSDKKVSYSKHTFIRKKNRSGHGYYYRAKDHVELFKVGSSFLKDFRSGLKSFSFSSVGLKEEREKSVLGILSFFNYHEDVSICVITESLAQSYYSRIATKAKKRQAQVFDEDLHYEFYTGDGFEVIEYAELKKIERKITAYNFEDFLDFLLDSFDIILWDLPEIEVLDSNKEVYFPIVRSLDNVSFIVGKNISKISEINEMISYFKRYQIAIKGLLFSDSTKDKGGKK